MSGSYCCLWLLPMPEPIDTGIIENVYHLNDTIYLKKYQNTTSLEKYTCHWNCSLDSFDVYLTNDSDTYVNTVYVAEDVRNTSCSLLYMELDEVREGEVICLPKSSCNLMCYEDKLILNINKRDIDSKMNDNFLDSSQKDRVTFSSTVEAKNEDNFYMTVTFWAFVVLMCVVNFFETVCFSLLGPERASKYGAQRAWGTVGYGLTALAGGCLIDLVSGTYKDFTPAFAIALVATVVDLYSCRKLTLPSLSSPADSGKALREVLKIPRVLVFITFAVVAGTFDSFIIYYMFW
ncbi:Major facilitator superfamily domain-containing protein 6 [Operophtera brumata]|uniref:Major facilitator superfamily domain-containing protein 6 n=1 Tax=Operophtera brumata TaxID=104452 RepID=A0A0L7LL11_OPEBR|nr:Major facilitator superfamily domain-containing protein 6 [Operophtera brumata]